MDLIHLDNNDDKAVYNAVDTVACFSTATFLDDHGANFGPKIDVIWSEFVTA